MNKVYLAGKIIDISKLKFFYNSKKHDSQIIVTLKTWESNLKKSVVIELIAYDNMADIIYKNYETGCTISIEGRIVNSKVEITKVY